MSGPSSPPEPDGVPLLGHSLPFSRDPFVAIERWTDLAGVVRVRFPGQHLYPLGDPALVREMLVDRHDAFTLAESQRETFADVEDDAVTGSAGNQWRRLRRALQPAFTAEHIAGFGRTMAERAVEDVAEWPAGPSTPIDGSGS